MEDNKVTRSERWALRYCLTEFKWTDAAIAYLYEKLQGISQEDDEDAEEPQPKKARTQNYYEKIDGLQLDGKIVEACREAVKDKGDGRVSVEDAKDLLAKATDGGKVTRCE